MGRLSRYKKVKSIDPYAKNGSWKSDVGDCATLHRVKRKSKTALRMKEQKMNKLQRRMRGKKMKDDGKKSGGSNGWGDDDGYDLPPAGGDEFDMNDLMGSVKKKSPAGNPLLDTKMPSQLAPTSVSGGDEKWTRKVERIDLRGVGVASSENEAKDRMPSSKKQQNNVDKKQDGKFTITAKTPTREIIEACSNPKSQKHARKDLSSSSTGLTKQEKRKAFLEKKKLKKRKRANIGLDNDDEDDYAKQQALQSLHSQSSQIKAAKTKKHLVKQQNFSNTLVARKVIDDQVERPPTFTSLPRGANKLSKNKKATGSNNKNEGNNYLMGDEDKNATSQRIRKEQQALEAMREKVMKQYAILRESRRNGGR